MEQASFEAWEILQWFARHEAERRNQNRQKVVEALRIVPASEDTLSALGGLSPEDAERALRTHPGYLGERNIESIRTMLELFRRALADLASAIAEFPEVGGPGDRTLRESLEKDISVRVNKELFAALGAAKALVDYSRRIKGLVGTNVFDSKVRETFDPGENALILELRRVVHHAVHSKANWQQRWIDGMKTTHFVINREELLAEQRLSSAARDYLEQIGTTCDVTELLQRYGEKVELFNGWLLSEVESSLPLEIRDYRACRKSVRQQHGRSSHELMIGLWTQAGVDPYEHLSKHLSSEQMKQMEVLSHRSPEQVDYVIACLDRDGLCEDAHLRAVVHKFFGVSASDQ